LSVVDTAAARLGLVDWRTTTTEHDRSGPLFPDNFIRPNVEAIERYWEHPLLQGERQLLNALMTSQMSEFFNSLYLSQLDRFSGYSWSRSPVEKLNYGRARSALLEVLAELAPDTWHSVAALVEGVRRTKPELLFGALESRQCDLVEDVPGQSRYQCQKLNGHGTLLNNERGVISKDSWRASPCFWATWMWPTT
jgi:hypothetical protein